MGDGIRSCSRHIADRDMLPDKPVKQQQGMGQTETMFCNVMRRSAVQCIVMQCNAIRSKAMHKVEFGCEAYP